MKAARTPFYLSLALTALMATTLSWALPGDREQPIHIKADNADVDNANGIAIYRGNAVITQGTTKLTGDIITIYSTNREIQRVVSEGDKDLAYYEEEQEDDKGKLQAWGVTIDYNMGTDKIKLIKKARLIQKGDTFTGDQIDYDQLKQLVNAQGQQGESNGRVQMIIQPNQTPGSSR